MLFNSQILIRTDPYIEKLESVKDAITHEQLLTINFKLPEISSETPNFNFSFKTIFPPILYYSENLSVWKRIGVLYLLLYIELKETNNTIGIGFAQFDRLRRRQIIAKCVGGDYANMPWDQLKVWIEDRVWNQNIR